MMRNGKWLRGLVASLLGVLCAVAVGIGVMQAPTQPAQAAGEVQFEDSFDYDGFEKSFFEMGVWSAEKKANGSHEEYGEPRLVDGVLRVDEGKGAQFLWQNVSGFSFDSALTYTMTFDVKVTSFGDDKGYLQIREFYFAPGGWFNQIELKSSADANKAIRTGGNYCGNKDVEYKLNTVYSITAVWVPASGTITTTLKDGNTVVSTGSRTSGDYKTASGYLSNWVFRCEDGSFEMDNFTFTDGTNVYTEDFTYDMPDEYMAGQGYWRKTDMMRPSGSAPTVEDGVVRFTAKQNMEFNWYELTTHEANKIYTFEFDLKITDAGTGADWSAAACTRALYLSFGGWWTLLELPSSTNKVRAGDTYVDYTDATYLNKPLHVKVELDGGTVTTTIYGGDGKTLVTGSRTDSAFAAGTQDVYVPHLAFRCEDGAFELDNFSFYSKTFEKVDEKALEATATTATTYTATVVSDGENKVSLRLNGTDFFTILPTGTMNIGGATVKGTYGAGEYTVSATVNLTQKMVMIEVVLPGGGIVRRGSYNLLKANATAYAVSTHAVSATYVKDVSVTKADVALNEYVINEVRPTGEGFYANVYNIITSFDDAATTRNFAFTALASFVGNGTMAVRYRKVGDSAWTVENAIREVESANATEDYYKVDVEGLSPNTEYEYQIGKVGSENEALDWSKLYTFKTATGTEDAFTFLAVGDTQGITWNGRTGGTKGFMFAQTAIEEAFAEHANAAFMLHTGDVVENGGNVDQWNMFFESMGDYGAQVPFFATIGNHDVVGLGDAEQSHYFDLHFNHPNNGGTQVLDKTHTDKITDGYLKVLANKAEETVYSFNYGDAHFAVLASGRYAADDEHLLMAQRDWLDADLKANACAKWKVVLVHEPVYHRVGGNESRPWLYDVIEGNGVDLVIQGHSHLVTRSYPMKNGSIVSKTLGDTIAQGVGTVYTTVGSTAYNHDGLGNPNVEEMMVIATPEAEQPTYTAVTVDGDKLVMTVKQINGLVVDRFEITADPDKADHFGTIGTVGAEGETCGKDGYTGDQVCSLCKRIVVKGEVIPATGDHVFDQTVVDDAFKISGATCSQKARYHKSCVCGAVGSQYFEVGEMLPHEYEDEHTCHDRACVNCDHIELATTQHDWTEGIVTTQPTKKEQGEKTYRCRTCAEKRVEILPATGGCGASLGATASVYVCILAIAMALCIVVLTKKKA